MSGTAILDTFLTVISNDVANRLANDERFVLNIARAIAADRVSVAALVPEVAAELVSTDLLDDTIGHRFSRLMEDHTFDAGSIVNLEDAIDDRIKSEVLNSGNLDEAIAEAIERYIATHSAPVVSVLEVIASHEGRMAIMKSLAAGLAKSAAPSSEALDLDEAFTDEMKAPAEPSVNN